MHVCKHFSGRVIKNRYFWGSEHTPLDFCYKQLNGLPKKCTNSYLTALTYHMPNAGCQFLKFLSVFLLAVLFSFHWLLMHLMVYLMFGNFFVVKKFFTGKFALNLCFSKGFDHFFYWVICPYFWRGSLYSVDTNSGIFFLPVVCPLTLWCLL